MEFDGRLAAWQHNGRWYAVAVPGSPPDFIMDGMKESMQGGDGFDTRAEAVAFAFSLIGG